MRIEEASVEAFRKLHEKTEESKLKDNRVKLATELAKMADHYKSKIEHIVWREIQALESVKRLGEHPELITYMDKYCEDITNAGKRENQKLEEALRFIAKASAITVPAEVEETKTDQMLKKLVPKRLFKGSLESDALRRAIGDKEYEWYEMILERDIDFSKKMLEVVNFMDGKRSAYNIMRAISAEYSPTDADHMLKLLQDLQKANLIVFQ